MGKPTAASGNLKLGASHTRGASKILFRLLVGGPQFVDFVNGLHGVFFRGGGVRMQRGLVGGDLVLNVGVSRFERVFPLYWHLGKGRGRKLEIWSRKDSKELPNDCFDIDF
jgi:hypothetical protein